MTKKETNKNIGGTMDQMTTDELHELLDATLDNAQDDWRRTADRAMEYLIRRRQEFAADDLYALLDGVGVTTQEPRAIGALFNAYARRGEIVWAGSFRHSRRKNQHRRLLKVWRAA